MVCPVPFSEDCRLQDAAAARAVVHSTPVRLRDTEGPLPAKRTYPLNTGGISTFKVGKEVHAFLVEAAGRAAQVILKFPPNLL
jgi:hypothetical protein